MHYLSFLELKKQPVTLRLQYFNEKVASLGSVFILHFFSFLSDSTQHAVLAYLFLLIG